MASLSSQHHSQPVADRNQRDTIVNHLSRLTDEEIRVMEYIDYLEWRRSGGINDGF